MSGDDLFSDSINNLTKKIITPTSSTPKKFYAFKSLEKENIGLGLTSLPLQIDILSTTAKETIMCEKEIGLNGTTNLQIDKSVAQYYDNAKLTPTNEQNYQSNGEFINIPVSPGLKNRVRERLFSLVNRIDGYTCNTNSSEIPPYCVCTTNSNFKMKNCGTSIRSEGNYGTDFIHNNSSPMTLHNSSNIKSRPIDLCKLNSLQKLIYSRTVQSSNKPKANEDFDLKNIQKDSSTKDVIEIYPTLLEESIKIIDSMKTRIEELEREQKCPSCDNQMGGSQTIDFINQSVNLNSKGNDLEQKSSILRLEESPSGNLLYNQLLENKCASLQKFNESYQFEINCLKAQIQAYENQEKDRQERAKVIQEALKQMYMSMLERVNKDHKLLMDELRDKLQSREVEVENLKQSLKKSHKLNKRMQQLYIDLSNKNKFSNNSQTHERVKDSSKKISLKEQYKDLLDETEDYAFAQIYEYKKAVRHLKEEIAKMKPTNLF